MVSKIHPDFYSSQELPQFLKLVITKSLEIVPIPEMEAFGANFF
jgi:hypothetical protein